MEMEQAPILSCTIQIDGLRCHTWQGRVLAEGESLAFQSERDLILAVERLLTEKDGVQGQKDRDKA